MRNSKQVRIKIENRPIRSLLEVKELHGYITVDTIHCMGCRSLQNLYGCPEKVHTLIINHSGLKNLKGSLNSVDKLFLTGNYDLVSLEGCPQNVYAFSCYGSTSLKSLSHCPKYIEQKFVTSFCSNLVLHRVWEDIHSCPEYVHFGAIHPKSGLLGLLRIKNLKVVNGTSAIINIINKYLPIRSMSDVMKCKQELTANGYDHNARM